jgi:hypothetical protein
MCDFAPGDEVICVDASGWEGRLAEGVHYTVAEVIPAGTPHPLAPPDTAPNKSDCIDLAEAPQPPELVPTFAIFMGFGFLCLWGYGAFRFRKVIKPDPLSIESLTGDRIDFEEPKRAPKGIPIPVGWGTHRVRCRLFAYIGFRR